MASKISGRKSKVYLFPQRQSSILIIIPAYNEQDNIPSVVEEVRQWVRYADIMIVNDGSKDDTAEVAHICGAEVLDLPINLGIGGAVQAGLKMAIERDYAFVMRIDADGQHNPAELPPLLEMVMNGQADVAIGSRFCNGNSTYRPPFARRLGIKIFSIVVSICVGHPVYDTTSGMMCLNRQAAAYLAEYCPQDYPEVEAHILFSKANFKVVELPVHMRPRIAGVSSINAIRAIYYIFKVLLAAGITALQDKPKTREQEEKYVSVAVHATR